MRRTSLLRSWAGLTAAAAMAAGLLTGGPGTPTASAATAGTVTIGGKCLDDADFGTANGNVIQIFSCNGDSAQNWTWQPDGTVTVYGKCLDVTGASNANGALVQLYTCVSGVPQQQFAYLPDGTIYSVKSGKCLAVQGGSLADHARVGLAPCDPSQSVQKWNASTAPPPKYTLSSSTAVSYARPTTLPPPCTSTRTGSSTTSRPMPSTGRPRAARGASSPAATSTPPPSRPSPAP